MLSLNVVHCSTLGQHASFGMHVYLESAACAITMVDASATELVIDLIFYDWQLKPKDNYIGRKEAAMCLSIGVYGHYIFTSIMAWRPSDD